MSWLRLCFVAVLWLGAATFSHAKPTILVTFSILEDLVKQVAGDSVQIRTLVPPLKDPHTYEIKTSDRILMEEVDLIIAYAPAFEGWLGQVLSHFEIKLIFVANHHPFRTLEGGSIDPHTWHDVSMVLPVVDAIKNALCELEPSQKTLFEKRADSFKEELRDLDAELKALFETIPREKRTVLTTHDAFWYFGKAYGITFLAPIGITTEEEPSANVIAKLIDQMRDSNVRAIFIENLSNSAVVEKIASEVGGRVGGMLFADSLSEDESANTYIKMIRLNADTLYKALTE